MTIEDFLEILEQRDLVPASIVKQVRSKVEKGDRRITPKSLLKYLVKKELVTKQQAKQLLETTLTVSPNAESSILGMVPMPKVTPKSKPREEEIPTITPVEEPAAESSNASESLVTDETNDETDVLGAKPPSLLSESLSKIGVGDATLTEALQESSLDTDQPDKPRRKKRVKKNEWDSSLLLLGGGGLILLIITGVIIGYLLNREDADAVFAEANAFFDGGSYTQAIKQYERFVENHPSHPEHSVGKVKLGLARLWKASSNASNFPGALETAQQVLKEIEDEEEFASAQDDLASLLPKIAQGLANAAEKSKSPDKTQNLVSLTDSALSLCANTKYIPSRFRDEVLLGEINQTLERVERATSQNAGLAKAVAEMQAAIDRRETARAYQIHDQLLDQFPGLINNEQLAAKVLEISAAESAVVKYIAESQPATTEPRRSNVVAEFVLANRNGKPTSAGEGIVSVRVNGAVYALNVRDGSLLWRRFVGAAPRLTPVTLSTGDLLVVDDQHHELLLLGGDNGKLIWRQPFESAILRPVILRDQALVAEAAGRLHVVDLTSGERRGYVQFAQPLSASPAVGSGGKRIYVTGEHSSLYTLSADDFSCLGVFFLNHAKGSVTTAPVSVLNKVIVAVAKGLSTSRLEVINTTADGIANQRATDRRLSGLVDTPLLVEGRRVVALTSQGQAVVYEASSDTGEEALTAIAAREPVSGDAIARFGHLAKGNVWIAGNRLSKLAILPTSDRLSVSTIDRDYLDDVFDHPLQAVGNLLVHVRRPADGAGVIVAAMDVTSGKTTWETELAMAPAGPPAVDPAGARIGVISASGLGYLIDRKAMSRRVIDEAVEAPSRRRLPPLDQCVDLGNGRLLASAERGETVLHYRPNGSQADLKKIRLVGPVACPPVAWEDQFVVATSTGQVYLYASDTGDQLGSPFQPALKPGVTYHWMTPAVYGRGESSQLVLSDGKEKIYLLSRATAPQPHLTATADADLSTSPLNTRIAVIGDLAVVGSEDGSLRVFELPSLSAKDSIALQTQVTWGPFTVGQNVLLATATEEFVCLDDQAKIVWRQPLAHGPPAGMPIVHKQGLVVLWQRGGLSRLDSVDGGEIGFLPLPQPALAGPVAFGKRLIVSSYDGTLLIVEYP